VVDLQRSFDLFDLFDSFVVVEDLFAFDLAAVVVEPFCIVVAVAIVVVAIVVVAVVVFDVVVSYPYVAAAVVAESLDFVFAAVLEKKFVLFECTLAIYMKIEFLI
jgi:hypothetical protein